MRQKMNRIQNKNHDMRSYTIDEISLSSYDDKKHKKRLKDEYSRLSHFHRSTR